MFEPFPNLCHVPYTDFYIVEKTFNFVWVYGGKTVTVPETFYTDLVSVPRPLWFFFPRDDKHILEAAVVHDWLYASKEIQTKVLKRASLPLDLLTDNINRKEADLILRAGMEALRVPLIEKVSVYSAVRLFGGTVFKKRKEEDVHR